MQGEDEAGAQFAVLTGLLEDAASLAAEGQSPAPTVGERCGIAAELRQLLSHAGLALDELEATLRAG